MTKEEVGVKILRMQSIQRGTLKPIWSDYNDAKRFQVREVEVGGVLVSRLVKKDTNLKILPKIQYLVVYTYTRVNTGTKNYHHHPCPLG